MLFPLESNPELMTKFISNLGVPKQWQLVDVYGLDKECLEWIPRPVLALILLFPCSDNFNKHAEEETTNIKETGQIVASDLFFMKQNISNACGTIALVHAVANNADTLGLLDGPFKNFLAETKDLSADERAEKFSMSEKNMEGYNFLMTHQEIALEGQTDAKVDVNHHFVAFVEKGGYLYELDGRKEFPINHGKTTPEALLEDAAKICQEFIKRDADDINFTVMALSASD